MAKKLSDKDIVHIQQLLKEAKLDQHEIAALFCVNQGRISEINTGKRRASAKSLDKQLPLFPDEISLPACPVCEAPLLKGGDCIRKCNASL